MLKLKKFNIILLIIWLIVIFVFSQDNGSSSSSKSDGIATLIVNVIGDITGKDYTDSEFKNILDSCIFWFA